MTEATGIFKDNLWLMCGKHCNDSDILVSVNVNVENSNLDLNWDTDESYTLDMKLKGFFLIFR